MTGPANSTAERLEEPLAPKDDARLKDTSARNSFIVLGGVAVILGILPRHPQRALRERGGPDADRRDHRGRAGTS